MAFVEAPNPAETILPADRTPSSAHVLPTKGLQVTEDLLQLIRSRVRMIALLSIGLSAFGSVVSLAFLLSGRADVFGSGFNVVAQATNLAAAMFVWGAARGGRFSNTTVLYLGLSLEVLLCLAAASAGQLWYYLDTGAPMFMSWCIPIVILFPVVIPGPPRTMLLASIAAASMEPIAAFGLWARGVYGTDALLSTLPGTVISPTLAVIIAYFASRTIYGLNVDVAKAKQMGSYQLR